MNRQFRRAQEKQDKKQEKEKARKREERRSRLKALRASRKSGKSASSAEKSGSTAKSRELGQADSGEGAGKPAGRGRLPGRFAGVLAAVTVFFITLQGVAPVEGDETVGTRLIGAGFYLMLGYFATLWFMRRGVERALLMSVLGGILLAVSVTVAAMVQGREYDLLVLALVVPALVIGAFLGRLVFVATPR